MSEIQSDYAYNYKTEFKIWKENKEFEHQNILMSRPPLYLTPIGMNTKNAKNIAFGIDSCWYENTRPQTTNTSNGIIKTQIKVVK